MVAYHLMCVGMTKYFNPTRSIDELHGLSLSSLFILFNVTKFKYYLTNKEANGRK